MIRLARRGRVGRDRRREERGPLKLWVHRGLQRRGGQGRALAQPRQTLRRGRIVGSRFALALLPVHRGRARALQKRQLAGAFGRHRPWLTRVADGERVGRHHHRAAAGRGAHVDRLRRSGAQRARARSPRVRVPPADPFALRRLLLRALRLPNRPSRAQAHVVQKLLRVALVVLLQSPRSARHVGPFAALLVHARASARGSAVKGPA